MRDFREQNYYELLDIEPHSSQQEVERSYQRARRIYRRDSVATYALFQPQELDLLCRRIEEAFRTLVDPVKRRAYDEEITSLEGRAVFEPPPDVVEDEAFDARPATEKHNAPTAERSATPTTAADRTEPEIEVERIGRPGASPRKPDVSISPAVEPEDRRARKEPSAAPSDVRPATCPEPVKPSMPDITERTEITGALIQQARLASGFTLDDIAQVTKIGRFYLRAIEDDRFDDLPAAVYVRGYLRQVAQMIGLDPQKAVAGYIERMDRTKE